MIKILEIDETPFHELYYRNSGPKGSVQIQTLPFYKVHVEGLPSHISSIVITADLQGRELNETTNRLAGEAVAEELSLLQDLSQIPPIDLIVLAGDLYDYPEIGKLGGTGNVTSVWIKFAELFPYVIGVNGNHDIISYEEMPQNTHILDGDQKTLNGLKIGGVSGIIGRPDKHQRKTETDFIKSIKSATRKNSDILVLHQGPDDPANDQIGEPLIRKQLKQTDTSLVIFGHCHWQIPFIENESQQLLNVDNRVFILTN